MGLQTPLDAQTILIPDGIRFRTGQVLAKGSNAIVYDGFLYTGPDNPQRVLIRELFPFDAEGRILRQPSGQLAVQPEAEGLWRRHKESFLAANQAHLRLLTDHPELPAMQCYSFNNTLYTLVDYPEGRSLLTQLKTEETSLRLITQRMLRLLDAVEAFHKIGSVHLDIRPETILLVDRDDSEGCFLVDVHAVHTIGKTDVTYLSHQPGYTAPEVENGDPGGIGFSSDLYSVAAVFFHCLMGRKLTLEELLRPKAPDGRESALLQNANQPVQLMAAHILKKGLHVLPAKRYRSVGQMRQAFRELLNRIDHAGVTHQAIWEAGRRSIDRWLRAEPAEALADGNGRPFPRCLSLPDSPLPPEVYCQQSKRYSPNSPAVFYLSLENHQPEHPHYLIDRILHSMGFPPDAPALSDARSILLELLEDPGITQPSILLLDGMAQGASAELREINRFPTLPGIRLHSARAQSTQPANNETDSSR